MSQQPPKSFSGRKHRVWSGETLDINLFWWLTYFKSILISLQALQCILCLPHIRHNFIRTTPPLRQTQILGERILETRLLFLIIYVRYTALSKSLIKSKLYQLKKQRKYLLANRIFMLLLPIVYFLFLWGPGTLGGIYLDYSQYPLGYLCLPSDQASMWASLRFILTVVKDVFFHPSSSPCPSHSPFSYN